MTWPFPKVPQIAHLYWGHEKQHLPYLRYLTLYSLRRYNPEWRIILHAPKFPSPSRVTWATGEQSRSLVLGKNFMSELGALRIEIIEHDFRDYGFPNDAHEVHKSDFLRWRLLDEYGGIWSDIDIIYTKPLDYLEATPAAPNADTGIHIYPDLKLHAIGFLFSKPGNALFKFCHEHARHNFQQSGYQSIGSDILNQFFPSLDSITEKYPELVPSNIDVRAVYPISSTRIANLYIAGITTNLNNSIGIHWFAGHPMSRMFENICLDRHSTLTPCLMSEIISKLML